MAWCSSLTADRQDRRSQMKSTASGAIAVAIAIAMGVGLAAGCSEQASASGEHRGAAVATPAGMARPVPRLVDVGAGKCIPCKAMAPILDQLRADYVGRLEVTFIDVWKNPAEADPYRIHMIPTQIFFAADGRELARHEGFMSREEILARWKSLGVEL
jgi:thioredoxin 1